MKIRDSLRPHIDKALKRIHSSFFLYDLDELEERLKEIKSLLHPDIKLWYAAKANPLSAILKLLRNYGFGVDVASKGELDQVLRAGIFSPNILSTGPAKSESFLRELLENDVDIIVLESHYQLQWLNKVAKELGKVPHALLRIQLDWGDGQSVLGGGEITPFGISPDQWKEISLEDFPHVKVIGLHAFQWGNLLDLNRIEEIWRKTLKEMKDLSLQMKFPLEVVDLGGGLGVPYNFKDRPIAFKDVHDILLKLKNEYSLNKIWMELGRYIVGPIGHYFTQIVDKKVVRGRNILITEGGINHIARSALTGEFFPIMSYRSLDAEDIPYQIHGPLCTSLDRLGICELPNHLETSDWLVFCQSGAYGFTEAMPFFLCHHLPAELVYYKGDLMTPRPVKMAQDWLV